MSDLENFRRETRAWLEANCPPEMRRPMTSEEDTFWGGRNTKFSSEPQRVWFERMRDKGWTVPHWPKEYGGGGLDPEQAKILRQEMAALGARQPLTSFGISMLGPALLKYGTEAQKQEHLPRIAAGLIRWCQGYSEPNAGSDLASLQTRAESDGDDFIINGQKIWTSYAHAAAFGILICRTDPAAQKHHGITYLICPMDAPGVTVRPIVEMTGAHNFNEVFFDEVRVPAVNMIGAPGEGWRVAGASLAEERSNVGGAGGVDPVQRLVGLARRHNRGGRPAVEDGAVRQQIGGFAARSRIQRHLGQRMATKAMKGQITAADAPLAKIWFSELNLEMVEAALALQGARSMAVEGDELTVEDGRWQDAFLYARAWTIAGGSNEIMRNLIAERGLGLPREPRGQS